MSQDDGELLAALKRLRGVFSDGVSSELVIRVHGLLGMYLTYQSIAVWENVVDGDFTGDSDQFAVVGSVTYELPVQLWDYLTSGEGPDPEDWDFRPHKVAKVRAEIVPADPTGLNRLLVPSRR